MKQGVDTACCASARYRSIYVPFDNSMHALQAAEIGVAIAQRTGACLTGSHVYAAALHDRRFRQMEGGLPEPYREERKLVEQREIHDDLITRGLRTISDSYLDVLAARCAQAGVAFRPAALEGRNWKELVADIARSSPDLVVMGAAGLGEAADRSLGSVCARVARGIDRDLLVVRSGTDRHTAPIVAALDGSAQGFAALDAALALGRLLGRRVEAIAAFDPFFHYVAFRRMAGVLSEEAAQAFRFEQQEELHADIIDSGLAKIYQGHLAVAAKIAAEAGVTLGTELLPGKALDRILAYAREREPWLLVLGRTGAHAEPGMDIGSTSENVLRSASCHVLLAAGASPPPARFVVEATMAWTAEARMRMERVPAAVQRMARQAVIAHAAKHGHTVITSDVIDTCLDSIASEKCPYAHRASPAKAASADP